MSGADASWTGEEDAEGWDGDLVRVSREVPFFDLDKHRDLTVEEYAARLVAAGQGLTNARVDGHLFYESVRVVVTGNRPPTADDLADRERREYLGWVAAKARYEQGVAKGYTPDDASRQTATP